MRGYGCGGECGTIVSVWARPGVPAFGGKYVTLWNGWKVKVSHALSHALQLPLIYVFLSDFGVLRCSLHLNIRRSQ